MKTRLVIAPKDASDLKLQLLESQKYKPNGYEIRIDHAKDVLYTHYELFDKIASLNIARNSILTLRSKEEGGRFTGSDDEKKVVIGNAQKLTPEIIDIEIGFAKRNPKFVQEIVNGKSKVLISSHDFEGTKEIAELAAMMIEMSIIGDMGKIVTTANSVSDILSLQELSYFAKKVGFHLTTFAMGELGQISRVLSAQSGGIAYTSLPGRQTAPGQLDIEKFNELKKLRKARSLSLS